MNRWKGAEDQAQKTCRYQADGDSSALLRPHCQASGAMFTTHIAQRSSGEVCTNNSPEYVIGCLSPLHHITAPYTQHKREQEETL